MIIETFSQNLNHTPLSTIEDAKALLNQYTLDEQKKIIAAMYIGRDYLQKDKFDEGHIPSSSEIDHIDQTEYADILYEKGAENFNKYLDSFVGCVKNSNIDMNNF